MIAGHFGLAAAVKARAPYTPLWALMLATVWLDVWFIPLLATGLETLSPAPGTHGGYGAVIIHADYTHALVDAFAISAVTGALAALRWGRRSGTIIGAVVFSHWLLDLLVHRHDMPLVPWGTGARVGFGLWSLPAVSTALELALVVVGTYLYWRTFRAGRIAVVMLVGGVIVLGLNLAGL